MASVASVPAAAWAGARAGQCVLSIGVDQYVDGPCDIVPTADGGFQFSARGYLVSVRKTGSDTGKAFWNGDEKRKKASKSLGKVWLVQGCWTNEEIVVCAK